MGFGHFDCAERYGNEEMVGTAIPAAAKAGEVRREDRFITTTLWNTNHRPERVLPVFEASFRRLNEPFTLGLMGMSETAIAIRTNSRD